jgi:hypothetical protein
VNLFRQPILQRLKVALLKSGFQAAQDFIGGGKELVTERLVKIFPQECAFSSYRLRLPYQLQ